jgi:autotransporter-associated beta strand protein
MPAFHHSLRLLAASTLLLVGGLASAQVVWDGGGSNNRWGTANNWNPNGVPTNTSDVRFDNSIVGTLPSTIQLRANQNARSLTFDTADTLAIINGTGNRTLTLANGTITRTAGSSGNQSLEFSTLALAANGNFTINGAGTFTISSVVANSGGTRSVAKNGDGLLVLSGNNTFSGGLTVNAGTVGFGHNAGAGTGTLTLAGGAIEAQGAARSLTNAVTVSGNFGVTGSNNLTLSGAMALGSATRTVNVDNTGTTTFSGILSGSGGALTKSGVGLLVLGNNNTYTGLTTVNDGILRLTNAGALGNTAAGTVVTAGGELQLAGGLTVAGEALTLAGSGPNGALVSVTGANTWNADITLAADATITSQSTGLFSLGIYNANPATNPDLVLAGHTVTLNAASSGQIRVASDIVGSGDVIIASTGSGSVEYYSTANTFTGTTYVNSGTLSLYSDNSGPGHFVVGDGTGTDTLVFNALNNQIGDAATVRVNRSGVLNLNNRSDTIGALTLEGGISAGTGRVTTGTGTLTLNGDVTLANHAASTQSAEIAGNLNLGSGPRVFDVGDSSPTVDLLVSATTSGTAGLIKDGAGTLQLSGTNTFTGNITVNAGSLRVSADANLGHTANDLTLAGGTLAAAGSFTLGAGRTLTVDGAGGIDVLAGQTLILGTAGQLTGNGTLTKTGDGTLALTALPDFTDNFVLDAGTLRLSDISLTLDSLTITGNSTIDFTGTSASLYVTTLNLNGFTLNITNWTNAVDYFFAANWTGAVTDTRGAAPMNQVSFNGFTGADTQWLGYEDNPGSGYQQITPVPEPSTYGALLLGALMALFTWRRRAYA